MFSVLVSTLFKNTNWTEFRKELYVNGLENLPLSEKKAFS